MDLRYPGGVLAPASAGWRAATFAVVLTLGCSIDDRSPRFEAASGAAEGLENGSPGTPSDSNGTRSALPSSESSLPGLVLVPGRVLTVARPAVDFGDVSRGQVVSLALGLRNAGDTAIDQLSIAIGGQDRDAFSVSPENCGESIAPGRECFLQLGFAPTAERSWEASLIATGAGTQQVRVPLSGVGIRPGTLVADTTSLSFGEHEAGSASDFQTVTVTNEGVEATGALTLDNPVPDQIRVESDCGPPLGPGASCAIRVQYLAARRAFLLEALTLADGRGNEVIVNVFATSDARLTIQFTGSGVGKITSDTGVECTADCSLLIDTFTTLTATTENGTNAVFTGWTSLPGCDAQRECTVLIDTPTTTVATFAAQTNNLAFVSSEGFRTDLGNADAYDAECNRLASQAGINDASGSAFIAAVSGSGAFWDRMAPSARGWARIDGLPLGDTPASLAAAGSPMYPIIYNEWGEVAPGLVQTGSTQDGSPADNCLDWSAASNANLALGDGSSGPGWLDLTRRACGTFEVPVYCLGARKTAPLVPMAFTGKRLWVTRDPLRIGEQSPDEACQLDRPAGVTLAIALISYSNRPAAALMDSTATYVRPDGALIGTVEHITRQTMVTGPWLTSDGALLIGSDAVWTGGSSVAELAAEQTCDDWRDPLGQGAQGSAIYSDFSAFGNRMITTSCATPARVYCIEE